jgi:hypothetical protein
MKLKWILLASTLLMLSNCVVPTKYGVNRTRAGSSELDAIAKQYWDRYLCKRGESSFFKFDGSFYQIAGAKPMGILLDTTHADKLNGIDATGVLRVESTARKDYSAGKWSKWSNDDISWLFVSIHKKNGKWEIEDNPRLQSINCNAIPI